MNRCQRRAPWTVRRSRQRFSPYPLAFIHSHAHFSSSLPDVLRRRRCRWLRPPLGHARTHQAGAHCPDQAGSNHANAGSGNPVSAQQCHHVRMRITMDIRSYGSCHIHHPFDQLSLLQSRSRIVPPLEFLAGEMIPRLQRKNAGAGTSRHRWNRVRRHLALFS